MLVARIKKLNQRTMKRRTTAWGESLTSYILRHIYLQALDLHEDGRIAVTRIKPWDICSLSAYPVQAYTSDHAFPENATIRPFVLETAICRILSTPQPITPPGYVHDFQHSPINHTRLASSISHSWMLSQELQLSPHLIGYAVVKRIIERINYDGAERVAARTFENVVCRISARQTSLVLSALVERVVLTGTRSGPRCGMQILLLHSRHAYQPTEK